MLRSRSSLATAARAAFASAHDIIAATPPPPSPPPPPTSTHRRATAAAVPSMSCCAAGCHCRVVARECPRLHRWGVRGHRGHRDVAGTAAGDSHHTAAQGAAKPHAFGQRSQTRSVRSETCSSAQPHASRHSGVCALRHTQQLARHLTSPEGCSNCDAARSPNTARSHHPTRRRRPKRCRCLSPALPRVALRDGLQSTQRER